MQSSGARLCPRGAFTSLFFAGDSSSAMRGLLFSISALLFLAACDSGNSVTFGDDLQGRWTLVSVDGDPAEGELQVPSGFFDLPTGQVAFPRMTGGARLDTPSDAEGRRRLDLRDWFISTSRSENLAADVFGFIESVDESQMVYVVLASDARLVFPATQTQSSIPFPGLATGTRLVFER